MGSREWRYDKNRVLNMWAAGMTCGAICEALGMARPEAVSVIVQRARRLGDERAAPRRQSLRYVAQPRPDPEVQITREALDAIPVPGWVPDHLYFLYRVFAKTRGHVGAASYVRGRMAAS